MSFETVFIQADSNSDIAQIVSDLENTEECIAVNQDTDVVEDDSWFLVYVRISSIGGNVDEVKSRIEKFDWFNKWEVHPHKEAPAYGWHSLD